MLLLSGIIGRNVRKPDGGALGRTADVTASVHGDAPRIERILVNGKHDLLVPWEAVVSLHHNDIQLNCDGTDFTFMGTPDRPDLQNELAETFCRTDPEHARVFAHATFLSDNRADLPRIPVPTLVIECAHDAIAPRGVGAYVHAHIPDSQLITLDATGHCPHVSAPDVTASAISAFARAT